MAEGSAAVATDSKPGATDSKPGGGAGAELLVAPAGAPAAPPSHPRICRLAVATPARTLDQAEVLDLLGLAGRPFAENVFARCGVRRRRLELSADLLGTSLQQRSQRTERQLLELAVGAIDQLGADPGEIGVVVTANYYSLGGPTLAHRLVERYALDPDTDKYHLLGVGCASAVPLLRLAAQALRDRPGRKALVVGAESVTGFLTRASADDERAKVIGSALFGDGCGAALLASGPEAEGPAVVATAVHQVAGTLDHVRFRVTGGESYMQIARELPAVAESELQPLVDGFLERQGIGFDAVDHWLVHPGGRGIIEGVQRGLGLSDEQVEPSVRVLSEYGNVGTASAFFVLRETIEQRRPQRGEQGLMITIGPGVTVGLMLLRW